MIDVVSGDLAKKHDWAKVWLESEENKEMMKEIEKINGGGEGKEAEDKEDDHYEYASTTRMQFKMVTKRASTQVSRFAASPLNYRLVRTATDQQLYRDTEYVVNKVMLHIGKPVSASWSVMR